MSRYSDTLLGDQAFARGAQMPVLNPVHGAQYGFMTEFVGYISNAAYVRRNLVCRLISAPIGFNDLPESALMISTLKSMVEVRALRIEGLQAQVTWEYVQTAFGGAGEQQDNISNATRQNSEPTFTWPEKYGRPVNRFLDYWGLMLIMDPITKFPGVISIPNAQPGDLLPDYVSATMLFYEPDPTGRFVDKAWLCANMMPKTSGEKMGRRDQTAAGEGQEHSIGFTAISQVGAGVDAFAQQLLSEMSYTGANPQLQPAFAQDVDPDVAAAASGYADQIASDGAQAISV